MRKKEIRIGMDKESAVFKYEFDKREVCNIGSNINEIIIQGLKQYKEKAGEYIEDKVLFKDIDEIIKNLEFVEKNIYEPVDVSKETKLAYKLLGKQINRMWY